MTPEIMRFVTMYSVMIMLSITGYIGPLVSRKGIIFGIYLNSEKIDQNQIFQLKQFYKLTYWIINIVYLFLTGIWYYTFPPVNLDPVLIFIQVLLVTTIYIIFNRKAACLKKLAPKKMPAEAYVAIDTSFRVEKLVVSVIWFLPALCIVIINFLVSYFFNNKEILKLTIPSFFVWLVFLFGYWIIKTAKQQISVNNPKTTKIQDQLFRYRWSMFLIIKATLFTLIFLMFSLQQIKIISLSANLILGINFLFIMSILITSLVLALKTGQSGSFIKSDFKEEGKNLTEYDDDKYWKLGSFYVNPNDPAIFIAKRLGIGWTINWGNPVAVIIFILMLVVPVAVMYLVP